MLDKDTIIREIMPHLNIAKEDFPVNILFMR
jgi:hypothetical protein